MQASDLLKELKIMKARVGGKCDVFIGIGPDYGTAIGTVNGAIYPDGCIKPTSGIFCWANTWEELIEKMYVEVSKLNTKRLASLFTTSIQ